MKDSRIKSLDINYLKLIYNYLLKPTDKTLIEKEFENGYFKLGFDLENNVYYYLFDGKFKEKELRNCFKLFLRYFSELNLVEDKETYSQEFYITYILDRPTEAKTPEELFKKFIITYNNLMDRCDE